MNTDVDDPAALADEPNEPVKAFDFVCVWPQAGAEDAEATRDFLRREKALDGDAAMDQRLPQVVMYARTSTGEAAGVRMAIAIMPQQLAQPVYH